MCGSPAVRLLADEVPAQPLAPSGFNPQPPPPPPPAPGVPNPDEFAKVLGPLFEEALDYVRARDRDRVVRENDLEEKENVRRERVTVAKLGFYADLVQLAESLNELAQSATKYLKARTDTTPPPQS